MPCLRGNSVNGNGLCGCSHCYYWRPLQPYPGGGGLTRTPVQNRPNSAPEIERTQPCPTQDPSKTQSEAVEAVHDELQTDQHAREHAHDEHRSGPRGPCNGTQKSDEREDSDDERKEGQA